jgi:hypothetical protein
MRTGRFAIGVLVTGLVVTSQLVAAPKLNEGTRELGVSGILGDTDGGIEMGVDAKAGYFMLDGLEAGVKVGWSYHSTDPDGSDYETSSAQFDVGAFGEYNFIIPNAPVVPYVGVGASIGYWSTETDAAGSAHDYDDSSFILILSGWGGAKFFVVDSLSIGCQFELDIASDDIYDGGDSMDWKFVLRTDYYF